MTTKKLLAIWQQNKSWPVILGALLLLIIVLYVTNQQLITPKVDALERDYISLQDRSRQARKMKTATDSPNTVYQRGIDDLEKFRTLIPPRDGLTDLVAELFRVAEKANIAINQINYAPKEIEEQNLLQYGLVFSITGSYRQLKTFISLIEASKRLIVIEGITIRSDLRSGNQGSLQLHLATYFQAGAA